MARKFLIVIAVLIGVVLVAGIAWSLFSDRLIRAAMVPGGGFVTQPALPAGRYADRSMWHARPDLPGNPAEYLPAGVVASADRPAAVFFIHPTSFLDRRAWNAPLDDLASQELARTFLRGQATVFNGVGQIWAPKYRQATFGAFLTTQPDAQQALDAAYADVLAAFDAFVAANPGRPLILAGHSQGSVHLLRLLRERVAGKPIATRIVAVYAVGWPVSVAHDLPALGLPACARADQAGCMLAWQSFAEPADPKQIVEAYDATTGFDGQPRRGSSMLCTNPLTGVPDSAAPATANRGALVPDINLKNAVLAAGRVPARCDARGFLLIGAPPEGFGAYILPGNNYHVFDYSLFWANIRADAARRLAAYAPR